MGTIALIFGIFLGKQKLAFKNVLGGLILGIPNYGSIYFLLKTLNNENWDSSIVFPVNNIGIVCLSVLFALLIFKEKLSKANYLGLTLAILSIVLMAVFYTQHQKTGF